MNNPTPQSLRELADTLSDLYNVGQDGPLDEAADALRAFATRLESDAGDVKRLNSNCIVIDSRDEFGEPLSTHHHGIDLRAAIDKAMAYEAGQDAALRASAGGEKG